MLAFWTSCQLQNTLIPVVLWSQQQNFHNLWDYPESSFKVYMPYMDTFLSALNSYRICNTQLVQDDQVIQIVRVAIDLIIFRSSYEYLIYYKSGHISPPNYVDY